jgi:glycosyltransferase involved in cell wall biosynthesis
MNVVIIHYHLHPGGVTQVIKSQIKSIQNAMPGAGIRILTGGCHDTSIYEALGAQITIKEELNYLDDIDYSKDELSSRLQKLKDYLTSQIAQQDIIHFHNLNLGKNPLLTLAIYYLAKEGYSIFNHCHDFAEDRPVNRAFLYKIIKTNFKLDPEKVLYPDIKNYQLGVINSFDKKRLMDMYNIPGYRIDLLPNPVNVQEISKATPNKKQARHSICNQLNIDKDLPIITYPVRVIKRKNIGEFILLAHLFAGQFHWMVTQPPKNPVEIEHYEKWKAFCQKYLIDIIWEAGTKVKFEELLAASHYCISTSIREGFGMVYLEPWLMDTPVFGRNIDYVTKDFLESGIEFPLLYEQLVVSFNGKETDFANLDETSKMDLIAGTISDHKSKDIILQKNISLKRIKVSLPKDIINKNKQIIKNKYSLEKYGERLHGIYEKLSGQ